MTAAVYENQTQACRDEVYGLLMNFHFYRRRISFLKKRGPAPTPEENIEDVVFLEALERDIIMGLCRLDDKENATFSFRHFHAESSRAEKVQQRVKTMTDAQKAFQNIINPAKTRLRNNYIAHLSTKHDASYMTPEELEPMVRQAVLTMDTIANNIQPYVITDKDSDFALDLRKSLNM